VFALAAEADEAKAFCECVGHVSFPFCATKIVFLYSY
jgi:hypothetical protein